MIVSKLKPVLFFILLSLTSCDGSSDKNSLNVKFIEVTSNEEATKSYQSLTRYLAEDVITNYKDSLTLDLNFRFLDNESVINISAYTTSMDEKTGSLISFVNTEKDVEVFLYFQDYPKFHFCHLENLVSPSGDVSIKVQFLNSPATGPVVSIWNMTDRTSIGRKRNQNYINIYTADCSTLKNNIPISLFGLGQRWGLELYKTKLNFVQRTEAYIL